MAYGRIALLAALLISGCAEPPAISSPPESVPEGMLPLRFAASAPAIDGNLDESVWQAAQPLVAAFVHGRPGVRAENPRLTVRAAWDRDYLYLGYVCTDPTLQALGTGRFEGPEERRREGAEFSCAGKTPDVVEFYLSFGSTTRFWEVHHNALDQWNDVLCLVAEPGSPEAADPAYGPTRIQFRSGEWLADDPPRRLATAVRLLSGSTLNDNRDKDAGYAGEIRIPWASLGPPPDWRPEAGAEFLLFAAEQDGASQAERYHHTAERLGTGFFAWYAATWTRVRLLGAGRGP